MYMYIYIYIIIQKLHILQVTSVQYSIEYHFRYMYVSANFSILEAYSATPWQNVATKNAIA